MTKKERKIMEERWDQKLAELEPEIQEILKQLTKLFKETMKEFNDYGTNIDDDFYIFATDDLESMTSRYLESYHSLRQKLRELEDQKRLLIYLKTGEYSIYLD